MGERRVASSNKVQVSIDGVEAGLVRKLNFITGQGLTIGGPPAGDPKGPEETLDVTLIGSVGGGQSMKRTISGDVDVPSDETLLQRCPVLLDGIEITIEDTGELLLI